MGVCLNASTLVNCIPSSLDTRSFVELCGVGGHMTQQFWLHCCHSVILQTQQTGCLVRWQTVQPGMYSQPCQSRNQSLLFIQRHVTSESEAHDGQD